MKLINNCFLFLILAIFAGVSYAQTNLMNKDLPNFHQISANFYRGGQPTEEGIKQLAKMGVKTIINLRGEDEKSNIEANWAKDNGMNFINVNLSNWFKPKTEDIERIIKDIDAVENNPVFVHCKRGADRTGTVVAVYRITHDNWTAKQAIDEAKTYRIGWWQIWMKDYINDYYRDFKNQNEFL